MTLLDEAGGNAELRQAIEHFTQSAAQTSRDTWMLEFETDLHSLAFSRATAERHLTLRPSTVRVDADGFEDWSISGPGEIEATPPILPQNAPQAPPGSRVFRYDMAWIKAETDEPPPRVLVERLGLAESMKGKVDWIWRAVKLGWDVTKTLDVRGEIVIWLAKQTWQKLERQNTEWRDGIQRFEADQRLIVRAAAERYVRLNTGTPTAKRKWAHYYATTDKLIALGL